MCQEAQEKVHSPQHSQTPASKRLLSTLSAQDHVCGSVTQSQIFKILKNSHEDLVYKGAQTNASRLDCPTPPLIFCQDNGPKNLSEYDAKPRLVSIGTDQ